MMKKVPLSFDNGPTAHVTPSVLCTLAERDLRAYFCVVGEQLRADDSNASLCKEALSLRHILVNHSLTHKTPLGECPTIEHARSEITAMHE